MQPYFFPYIGYFQLINAADMFIVLDDVQYIRHGWINRNRILKQTGGWQYVIAPVAKHSRESMIRDIRFSDDPGWRDHIIRQLEYYNKKAPFYTQTMGLIRESFSTGTNLISEFNMQSLTRTCQYIGIETPIKRSSALQLDYTSIRKPGDWALTISEQLNATCYINPQDGKDLFEAERFKKSGIELLFLSPHIENYKQHDHEFVGALSIIDVMMFNSIESIRNMLSATITP